MASSDPIEPVLSRLTGKAVQIQIRGGITVSGKLAGVGDRVVHLRVSARVEKRKPNGEVVSVGTVETDGWHRTADVVGVIELPVEPEEERRIVPVTGALPRRLDGARPAG